MQTYSWSRIKDLGYVKARFSLSLSLSLSLSPHSQVQVLATVSLGAV
jgi:hypothetical protein